MRAIGAVNANDAKGASQLAYRSRLTVVVVSESAFTVHDHGVHTAFVEQVAALEQLGVPVRVNQLRACAAADLVVAHTPGPYARACLRLARSRGIAYAHVTPATLAESLRFERVWRPAARAYLRRFYRLPPRLVAVSAVAREELIELGCQPERIVEIPNGIDGERIPRDVSLELAARVRAEAGGRPLVIGVGQVQPRKGIDAFMEVARSLPQYRFVWVGGRPFRSLTEGGIALEGKPDNMRFAGRVTDAELLAYYHAADVFLFPSRQENFGQVVVEAAASGLPLVLSDLAVFRESFGDNAIRGTTAVELVVAVWSLIEDQDFRTERVAAARALADRYTASAGAERLLALGARLAEPSLAGRLTPEQGVRP